MKIALVSSFVPFIKGGARNIVDWLELMLQKKGHQVEKIYLPELDSADLLFSQMIAYRFIDLEAADRVICFRPQAHLIFHHHKIIWFIHHVRGFYDLWDTPYGYPIDFKNKKVREALIETDTRALLEAKSIFTNSQVVSDRLKKFNSVDSEVLYPPIFESERFHCQKYSDEIVCVCRIEHHKRQHLLIDAMRYVKTPVKLRLSGSSSSPNYLSLLRSKISTYKLKKSVILDSRWISEEEKVEQFANCLAAAYLPVDEDSYGYPSLEASYAKKSILTTTDSGGVLELVVDGFNGYVVNPDAKSLAKALDLLYLKRDKTIQMGESALRRLNDLNIAWDHVIERVLA
jgi:glycosyltransferase involved in cell wall biosynthesis